MNSSSCRSFAQKATDYIDQNLPLGQRIAFKLHLSVCHHCRRYLRQQRVVQLVIGERSALPEQRSA